MSRYATIRPRNADAGEQAADLAGRGYSGKQATRMVGAAQKPDQARDFWRSLPLVQPELKL